MHSTPCPFKALYLSGDPMLISQGKTSTLCFFEKTLLAIFRAKTTVLREILLFHANGA